MNWPLALHLCHPFCTMKPARCASASLALPCRSGHVTGAMLRVPLEHKATFATIGFVEVSSFPHTRFLATHAAAHTQLSSLVAGGGVSAWLCGRSKAAGHRAAAARADNPHLASPSRGGCVEEKAGGGAGACTFSWLHRTCASLQFAGLPCSREAMLCTIAQVAGLAQLIAQICTRSLHVAAAGCQHGAGGRVLGRLACRSFDGVPVGWRPPRLPRNLRFLHAATCKYLR